jgi:hypothetical protein
MSLAPYAIAFTAGLALTSAAEAQCGGGPYTICRHPIGILPPLETRIMSVLSGWYLKLEIPGVSANIVAGLPSEDECKRLAAKFDYYSSLVKTECFK